MNETRLERLMCAAIAGLAGQGDYHTWGDLIDDAMEIACRTEERLDFEEVARKREQEQEQDQ